MVVHVGYNPSFACVYTLDTLTGEKTKTDLAYNKLSGLLFVRVELDTLLLFTKEMFKEIKSKIIGELGCLCACIRIEYGLNFRKEFCSQAIELGFKEVEIISFETSLFLSAIFYSKYEPKNGDAIFLIYDSECYVWKRSNNKSKVLGLIYPEYKNENGLKEVLAEIDEQNGVLLYDESFGNIINDLNSMQDQFLLYDYQSESEDIGVGPLIYARMMSNDPKMSKYKIQKVLEQKIIIFLHNSTTEQKKIVIDFQLPENLPITCILKLRNKQQYDGIVCEWKGMKESNFFLAGTPNATYFSKMDIKLESEDLNLVFKIDINGICEFYNEAHLLKLFPDVDEFLEVFNSTETEEAKNVKIINLTLPQVSCYKIPKKVDINDEAINAVGIDLGTSRCCAAVNRKNGVQTAALDNLGERLLPSYVAYDEVNVKCGKIVIDRLRNHSKSTVFDSKRMLGKTLDEIKIDKNWTFGIFEDRSKVKIKLNGRNNEMIKKHPEEISAALLKHIKFMLEEFQGQRLSQVVITVPAAFNDAQKDATRASALLAGWKVIYLLPEPVAAACAYFIDRAFPKDATTLLIFDLGGGTLDVCIFKIKDNELNFICRSGDPNLGGRDFDNILCEFFENLMMELFNSRVSKEKRYKLLLECQKIKHNLSVLPEDTFDVGEINASKDDLFIKITQKQFTKLCVTLLDAIQKTIDTSLLKANLKANQIDKVLYVGGGCRMPMIKKLLTDRFSQAEHCCEEHPDEVVAIGAAYYAYYLNTPTKVENNGCSVM